MHTLLRQHRNIGAELREPSAMIRSEVISASVTGDPSTLPSIVMRSRLTERTAAPAFATNAVRGSISAAAD